MQPFELASTFYIQADVKAGGDVSAVEKAIDEELARLIKEGPTAGELAQAVTTRRAAFVRGSERIGGFGGKADTLAECAVYAKDPGCFRRTLRSWAEATPANVRATGERWLAKGSHTLVVTPGERTVIPEEPAVTPAPFTLASARVALHHDGKRRRSHARRAEDGDVPRAHVSDASHGRRCVTAPP